MISDPSLPALGSWPLALEILHAGLLSRQPFSARVPPRFPAALYGQHSAQASKALWEYWSEYWSAAQGHSCSQRLPGPIPRKRETMPLLLVWIQSSRMAKTPPQPHPRLHFCDAGLRSILLSTTHLFPRLDIIFFIHTCTHTHPCAKYMPT